jgi:RNA polymerase sigma factor (TIGR02999 family)
MNKITAILSEAEKGDPRASEKLLPLVYEELRKLAAARLAQEKPGQTLSATSLVHEAYLRLVGAASSREWQGAGHFFAAAAAAIRRILVENARSKLTIKRGGKCRRTDFERALTIEADPLEDLLALDDALEKLRREDSLKAELVELRYFAGLTVDQTAAALGVSSATVNRHWAYAKAWLLAEMSEGERIGDFSGPE